MFRRLALIYARRIVNVNVNIVLAGLLALLPTLAVVHLVERLLASGFHPNEHLHLSDQATITGVTFVADMIFDVSIYYGLHWLANHWRRKGHDQLENIAEAAAENVPFFKDATKVQVQRMVLSPLLYLIFLGGQFTLMTTLGMRAVYATMIGFVCAILVARTLHTFWMLGEARGRATALAGHLCCVCGCHLKGLPSGSPCPECGRARPAQEGAPQAALSARDPAAESEPSRAPEQRADDSGRRAAPKSTVVHPRRRPSSPSS
ncbi:MAG: hypothetical protein IT438_06315 [Phycisphaerales bacterium]|nr:hypothetical protein [Phycisphaerales bacterium]